MARKLAHTEKRNDSSRSTGNKDAINRRSFVQLGVAAAAAALGAGAGGTTVSAQDETSETFATDFSEYAQ